MIITSSILISKSGHYYDYFPLALRVFLESKWKWFLLAGGGIIKYPLKMAGGSGFFGVFFRVLENMLVLEVVFADWTLHHWIIIIHRCAFDANTISFPKSREIFVNGNYGLYNVFFLGINLRCHAQQIFLFINVDVHVCISFLECRQCNLQWIFFMQPASKKVFDEYKWCL